MALPLLMLGLTAAGGIGAGVYVSKMGTEAADLKPRIFGVPAVPALGIGGIALAMFGGPILAPLGVGVAIGAMVAGDGLKRTREGLETYVAQQVSARLSTGQPVPLPGGPPAPPALPGPAPSAGKAILDLVSPLVSRPQAPVPGNP